MDKPTTASELAAILAPDDVASAHNALASVVSFYAGALQRARVREENLQRQLAVANSRAALLFAQVEELTKKQADEASKKP